MRIERSEGNLFPMRRGAPIAVWIDGRQTVAYLGETVAALLFAEGKRDFHYSEEMDQSHPGFFCGMGICFGCMIKADGRLVRACLTPVEDGMQILSRPAGEGD